MTVLGIDTSSNYCSVAVWQDGRIISEIAINNGLVHSQMLMPVVEQALANCGKDISKVDVFGCATGPGSFTGVRIAVSTVKGLAHAFNKPCVTVNTLEGAAKGIYAPNSIVCALLDARRGQAYAAAYLNGREVIPPCAVPIEELAQELIKIRKDEPIIFTADGAPVHFASLSNLLDNCHLASADVLYQRAASVALLAAQKAERGELINCYELDAFYLRKSQAEREYESKHREGT